MIRLTAAQVAALSHVCSVVRLHEESARDRVDEALRRSGIDTESYDAAILCIRQHARVVLHFHPDRLGTTRGSVAEGLLEDGVYRNQFETGRSSGGLLPAAGGPRDSWEHLLFGGAYQALGVTAAERPKYGALELIRFSDGPIPRFGSCYLVLRPGVSSRTSFTFAGSEDPLAPYRVGTIDRLDAVMAALFAELEAGAVAAPPWPPFRAPTLGVPDLTIAGLLSLVRQLASARAAPSHLEPGRVLDTQIEAQVHGPVELEHDVELLVADAAFASTPTGRVLREVATRNGFALQWHSGFRMAVSEVPDDFRGPEMPRLARRIAGGDGMLDAAVIGAAEATLHRQPELWQDWGTHAEVLQHLKQLWHVLVHYGGHAEG